MKGHTLTRTGGFGITSLQVNHLWLPTSRYILTLPGLSDQPNLVVLLSGYLLSALVWVRLPQCLLSIQVPAPSPGCSSSVELPACPSAPPTTSFGLRSPLPAPSRKCGLSLPSWGLRPLAQVSHVLNVEAPSFLKGIAISASVFFPQAMAPGWS